MAFDPNGPVVPTNGPSTDPMDMITRSAKLHGNVLTPQDTAYWMGKWDEWGKGDPTYFWKRLTEPPGPPAGADSVNDPLVYKTLSQVSQPYAPQSYGAGPTMTPAAIPQAPPESRIFGSAGGGAASLDPRTLQRDALVKMLVGRG